jgi:tetratricopeptide (TPR) repeat protein
LFPFKQKRILKTHCVIKNRSNKENLLPLLLISLIMGGCSNNNPNYQWNNVATWHSPISSKTYDDYMAAAHKAIAKGDTTVAIAMFLKAVDTAKSEYGPKDLRIATSASYLASIYDSLGNLENAESYYKKAYYIDKAALGTNHSETIRMRNLLIDVLTKRFKLAEAEKILHESDEIRR